MSLLEAKNVTRRFGGVIAVDAVDLSVETGEIVGLIGPNGAGKTTLFNILACAFPADTGEILFEGRPIAGLRASEVCGRGLTRTFQIPQPFPSMTVLETITTAALLHSRDIAAAIRRARLVAERVGLGGREDALTSALTNAQKKRLEVGRALGAAPRLLLLDEVMAGLNAAEVGRMLETIGRLRREGVTVLLVEHNMEAVMAICDRLVVLDSGRKIADGPPRTVVDSPEVIRAYLGDDTASADTDAADA